MWIFKSQVPVSAGQEGIAGKVPLEYTEICRQRIFFQPGQPHHDT